MQSIVRRWKSVVFFAMILFVRFENGKREEEKKNILINYNLYLLRWATDEIKKKNTIEYLHFSIAPIAQIGSNSIGYQHHFNHNEMLGDTCICAFL